MKIMWRMTYMTDVAYNTAAVKLTQTRSSKLGTAFITWAQFTTLNRPMIYKEQNQTLLSSLYNVWHKQQMSHQYQPLHAYFYITNMDDTELLPRLFYINISLHFSAGSPKVRRDNASRKTGTLKDVGNYATKHQVNGPRLSRNQAFMHSIRN